MVWKLADAKNRLSELVNKTLSDGPQTITRRNDEVVVISKEDFLRLRGEQPSFIDFLMDGPSLDGIDLSRDEEEMREVTL
jgi:prevent-host-death family protein